MIGVASALPVRARVLLRVCGVAGGSEATGVAVAEGAAAGVMRRAMRGKVKLPPASSMTLIWQT